jgi:hypothetical protein
VDSLYGSFVLEIMEFPDLKILQPFLNRLILNPYTMSQYSVERLADKSELKKVVDLG